jgi:hypothetical protein
MNAISAKLKIWEKKKKKKKPYAHHEAYEWEGSYTYK